MTPTVISPTNPALPSDVTRPCMFPMTSTGTNTTSGPNRTCSTIASPNSDRATLDRPPIQDLIVATKLSPAIGKLPPLVGLSYLTVIGESAEHIRIGQILQIRRIFPFWYLSINYISSKREFIYFKKFNIWK